MESVYRYNSKSVANSYAISQPADRVNNAQIYAVAVQRRAHSEYKRNKSSLNTNVLLHYTASSEKHSTPEDASYTVDETAGYEVEVTHTKVQYSRVTKLPSVTGRIEMRFLTQLTFSLPTRNKFVLFPVMLVQAARTTKAMLNK